MDGSTVVLVDTPGFDGVDVLPTYTVHELRRWLEKKYVLNHVSEYTTLIKPRYDKKVQLTGIIYLHPISDNRMTKVSPGVLKNLLKPEDASQVVLVTTMWDMTPAEVAEQREQQLRTLYWKDMLELGAQTDRFDNREETAWRIVRQLMAGNVSQCNRHISTSGRHITPVSILPHLGSQVRLYHTRTGKQ